MEYEVDTVFVIWQRVRNNQDCLPAWPGVSTAFNICPLKDIDVYLEDIVIPLSFSSTLLSMTRSSAKAVPQCAKSRSNSVVLP